MKHTDLLIGSLEKKKALLASSFSVYTVCIITDK